MRQTLEFSSKTFNEICDLLCKRLLASKDEQKALRAKIRRLGFNISDYRNGFTDEDFRGLLKSGNIKIINSTQSENRKIVPVKTITTLKSVIPLDVKKSMLPIVDAETKFIVLGTMPGEKSLLHQEYYNNPRNQFWKIISSLFNSGQIFKTYDEKLKILKRNKIGLWDVLEVCERKGSLDNKIKNASVNNFTLMFKKNPKITRVLFNGQDSFGYYVALNGLAAYKEHLILPSTSSANTRKTFEGKLELWANAFK